MNADAEGDFIYCSQSGGYIADARGGVDWLGGQSADYAGDYGYEAFTAQIDTVIMGGRTYRQITQELSPQQWFIRECKAM